MTIQTADADQRHREKTFVIVVNATEHTISAPLVSYDQVVALAYPTPPSPDTRFTVTYRKAKEPRHEGSLAAGQTAEVKPKGTIFNVTPTNRS